MPTPLHPDFWQLVEARLQGELSPDQHARLESLLLGNAAAQDAWFAAVDLHLSLSREYGPDAAPSNASPSAMSARASAVDSWKRRIGAALAAAVVLSLALVFLIPRRIAREQSDDQHQLAQSGSQSANSGTSAVSVASVKLSQVAAAEFADERTPEIGSAIPTGKNFVLRKGLVELAFPTGAMAIVKAPAVFTVESTERLRLDLGTCSVYAPDGAEGFEVIGPRTRVVDLGTRFSMEVNEVGVTDVQVLEGAAQMAPSDRPDATTLLHAGFAGQHAASGEVQPSKFDDRKYDRGLPDRVMKYEALESAPGRGVRDLESVTVQRGGRTYRYTAEELIGIEVVHFRSDANNSNVIWENEPPADPREVLSNDVALNTGIVNFGRTSKSAAASAPISERAGLGIRFREPLTNDDGDDLVLIEVHAAIYPPEGDAFRIGPASPSVGQQSVLIKQYDIGWSAADARLVAPFQLSRYQQLPTSIDDLRNGPFTPGRVTQALPYRALAVGIDLSDMGIERGGRISELFIEDAGDDESVLDPVFIGGFPKLVRPGMVPTTK